MKRCIFYLPYEPAKHKNNPRSLRPQKMVQAFQEIGYDVFIIWGRCSERKKLIKKLKDSIQHGDRYEFMYTECDTCPMFLTEPHHYPTHPLMDFHFFRYIKKAGIKIGLFYSDLHWKFQLFQSRKWWKRLIMFAFSVYDIKRYEELVDRFYVPNITMIHYIGSKKLEKIASTLLPGSDNITVDPKDYKNRNFSKKRLHILYAGGLHGHYRFTELLKAIAKMENCFLTLCCREQEWLIEKENIEPYLSENVHVIHKQHDELERYYKDVDIGALFYENSEYMNMAIPFKSFEYLAHEIPVIATTNMAIGEFTELNGNGWVIPYNADAVHELLNQIIRNPGMISEKQRNCVKAKQENLWAVRAKTVEQDLCH